VQVFAQLHYARCLAGSIDIQRWKGSQHDYSHANQ